MTAEQKEKEQKGEDTYYSTPAFNGALQTLERIHLTLIDISRYAVNENVLGMKANLRELFKEVQGFLNKAERLQAWRMWSLIDSFPIVQEERIVKYDSELLAALNKFDFWLRMKLHDHGVTFTDKKGFISNVWKLRKQYDL